jgi:hypothetical protein
MHPMNCQYEQSEFFQAVQPTIGSFSKTACAKNHWPHERYHEVLSYTNEQILIDLQLGKFPCMLLNGKSAAEFLLPGSKIENRPPSAAFYLWNQVQEATKKVARQDKKQREQQLPRGDWEGVVDPVVSHDQEQHLRSLLQELDELAQKVTGDQGFFVDQTSKRLDIVMQDQEETTTSTTRVKYMRLRKKLEQFIYALLFSSAIVLAGVVGWSMQTQQSRPTFGTPASELSTEKAGDCDQALERTAAGRQHREAETIKFCGRQHAPVARTLELCGRQHAPQSRALEMFA